MGSEDLFAVMHQRGEPMTAEEAHEALQAIGRAPTLTAVRAWLSSMEFTQRAERIEMRRGPAYRLVVGTAEPRPAVWVECVRCGDGHELTGSEIVARDLLREIDGYVVDSVLMLGRCRGCREALGET